MIFPFLLSNLETEWEERMSELLVMWGNDKTLIFLLWAPEQELVLFASLEHQGTGVLYN